MQIHSQPFDIGMKTLHHFVTVLLLMLSTVFSLPAQSETARRAKTQHLA